MILVLPTSSDIVATVNQCTKDQTEFDNMLSGCYEYILDLAMALRADNEPRYIEEYISVRQISSKCSLAALVKLLDWCSLMIANQIAINNLSDPYIVKIDKTSLTLTDSNDYI